MQKAAACRTPIVVVADAANPHQFPCKSRTRIKALSLPLPANRALDQTSGDSVLLPAEQAQTLLIVGVTSTFGQVAENISVYSTSLLVLSKELLASS